MLAEIEAKIEKSKKAFKLLSYKAEEISAKEFHDYMTAEVFSEDTTTLDDVMGNEFLMVHELVEMSELKKMGRKINKHTIMECPKVMIYQAHFSAMEQELSYALVKKDLVWAKTRLRQHKESVLENDPNLPKELKHKGEELLQKFSKLITELQRDD